MNERPTKIVITGKVGYEDEITPAQAAQIIGFLNSEAGATSHSGGGLPASSGGFRARAAGEAKVSSPRAALDASRAKTNPQKIVALAAYVLQDGGETFRLDAIKVQFQRAREATPKNLPRDLSSAISAGWITESETPGEYYLTEKVSNILEDGFPSDGAGSNSKGRARTSMVRARRTGGTAKKTKPEVFASIDVFPTVVNGVRPYHQTTTLKDKLLWALWVVKELWDIKGLTNSEAVWLTDELGDGISSKHISARFGYLRKAGHANRSTVDAKMKITPAGEEYLKSSTSKHG